MSANVKKKYESPRQLERQANILSVARQMLAEIGYEKTTIRKLADKAGVAPGTLYNLYNSKDELIVAAIEEVLAEVGERALPAPAGVPRIQTLFAITAEVTVDNPAYAEAVTRALFGRQRDDPLTNILYSQFVPMIQRHLDIAVENEQMRPDTPTATIAIHLQSQAWGIVVAWVMGLLQLDDVQPEMRRSITTTLAAHACGATAEGLRNEMHNGRPQS